MRYIYYEKKQKKISYDLKRSEFILLKETKKAMKNCLLKQTNLKTQDLN